MNSIAPDATMTLPPHVTFTESNGEVLIVDGSSERLYGVDGPAGEAFVLLARGLTFGETCARLTSSWDADLSTLKGDVEQALGPLCETLRAPIVARRA